MNAFCRETGVGLTPWAPLAGGFLASDWRSTRNQHSERARSGTSYSTKAYGTAQDCQVLDVLSALAARQLLGDAYTPNRYLGLLR
jgi:aryl-alcohol dehydrogenase-like predicted oxidoreductase